MSSSTAAAGTTISQAPTPSTLTPSTPTSRTTPSPRSTPPTAVAHDAHRTADLGRPRGRRSWSDFAEVELPQPATR